MLNSLVVLKHQRQKLYVCLEDLDFVWDEKEVKEFDRMWIEGLSIQDISRAFDRDMDEVVLLVMDRKRTGYINDRPGGVYGRRMLEQ
ncbi:helix-turn-helix domain-containing protein [Paenibacillus sp. TAB 01]|uniref:helix-turn-helix domain-containing protein n=1 Tax=Paenibacillus sp. TAB 01 TaxID=3368988 RepID=UPI00375061C7